MFTLSYSRENVKAREGLKIAKIISGSILTRTEDWPGSLDTDPAFNVAGVLFGTAPKTRLGKCHALKLLSTKKLDE